MKWLKFLEKDYEKYLEFCLEKFVRLPEGEEVGFHLLRLKENFDLLKFLILGPSENFNCIFEFPVSFFFVIRPLFMVELPIIGYTGDKLLRYMYSDSNEKISPL